MANHPSPKLSQNSVLLLLGAALVYNSYNTVFRRDPSAWLLQVEQPCDSPVSNKLSPTSDIFQGASTGQRDRCLSWDKGFSSLLEDHDQVYVLMAAKAAGSSLKHFTKMCMANSTGTNGSQQSRDPDNFLNDPRHFETFLTNSLQPPPLVTSHIYENNTPMLDLTRTSSRKSLFVYPYREETERLASAISYVFQYRLCASSEDLFKRSFPKLKSSDVGLERNETFCIADETLFLRLVIQAKLQEIRYSTPSHLNCAFWDEIEETGPTIVFAHYRQSSALQTQLAHRFCPELATTPTEVNVRGKDVAEGGVFYGMRLPNQQIVSLDEWMKAKLPTIEHFMKLSRGSCKRKTRLMEDEMTACPDHAVLFDAHNS